ncbi:MAG: hypothetical protein QM767_05015 [Anaeromyxobacter sp.]
MSNLLAHNWLPLSLAILLADVMKVHADAKRLERALARRTHASILGSVALGAFTPLCACGTMAVILGMLTATVPWAPIMAFLHLLAAHEPGWLRAAGGRGRRGVRGGRRHRVGGHRPGLRLRHLVETRTRWLADAVRRPRRAQRVRLRSGRAQGPRSQMRLRGRPGPAVLPDLQDAAAGSFDAATGLAIRIRSRPRCGASVHMAGLKVPEVIRAFRDVGARRILASFALLVAVGHLVDRFAPVELMGGLFGAGHAYWVPFAALVGLPFYVTTESSVPIIEALLRGGASKSTCSPSSITTCHQRLGGRRALNVGDCAAGPSPSTLPSSSPARSWLATATSCSWRCTGEGMLAGVVARAAAPASPGATGQPGS